MMSGDNLTPAGGIMVLRVASHDGAEEHGRAYACGQTAPAVAGFRSLSWEAEDERQGHAIGELSMKECRFFCAAIEFRRIFRHAQAHDRPPLRDPIVA
jgi:hypothetical protein